MTWRAVDQKVRNGRLVDAVLADGLLDEEVATRLWKDNTAHQMKRGSEAKQERAGEYKIKLRQMQVDLETAEIKLTRLKETTINREAARLAGRAAMRALRDHMLNFANRYGASIAGEIGADPGALMGLIDAKMRLALGEVAGSENPFPSGTHTDGVFDV